MNENTYIVRRLMNIYNKLTQFLIVFALIYSVLGCSENKNSSTERGDISGDLNISGAYSSYPIMKIWAVEFNKLHPAVKVDVVANGTGKGIMQVLSGKAHIGMISRQLSKDELEKGLWHISFAKDAVLPLMSAKNPDFRSISRKGLTKENFRQVYITDEIKYWGDAAGTLSRDLIHIIKRQDIAGDSEIWGNYLEKKEEDLAGFGVFGDPGMIDAIVKEPHAMGYASMGYVFDLETRKPAKGVGIIPIDLDKNGLIYPEENIYENVDKFIEALEKGIYPVSRNLQLVTNGTPKDRTVREFLNFIMNDGQKFLKESGYASIGVDSLNTQRAKLRNL